LSASATFSSGNGGGALFGAFGIGGSSTGMLVDWTWLVCSCFGGDVGGFGWLKGNGEVLEGRDRNGIIGRGRVRICGG